VYEKLRKTIPATTKKTFDFFIKFNKLLPTGKLQKNLLDHQVKQLPHETVYVNGILNYNF